MNKWYYCSLLCLTFCQPDVVCNMCKSVTPTPTQHDTRRKRKPTFTVDSGATIHCINDISLFKHFTNSPDKTVRIITANSGVIYAEAIGSVEIVLLDAHGREQTITLYTMSHTPPISIPTSSVCADYGGILALKHALVVETISNLYMTITDANSTSNASLPLSLYITLLHNVHNTFHLKCYTQDLDTPLQDA